MRDEPTRTSILMNVVVALTVLGAIGALYVPLLLG